MNTKLSAFLGATGGVVPQRQIDIWSSDIDPLSTSDLNCFAVVISGNDLPVASDNTCHTSEGSDFSFHTGEFGANLGEQLELSVSPGTRTIRIIGWHARSPEACQSLKQGTPSNSQLSRPFVIGTVDTDLSAGTNLIDITASLTGATRMTNCDRFLGEPVVATPEFSTISGTTTGITVPFKLTLLSIANFEQVQADFNSGAISTEDLEDFILIQTAEIDASGSGSFAAQTGSRILLTASDNRVLDHCTFNSSQIDLSFFGDRPEQEEFAKAQATVTQFSVLDFFAEAPILNGNAQVSIDCTPFDLIISGSVSGLSSGDFVGLRLVHFVGDGNDEQDQLVTASSSFAFNPIAAGRNYDVQFDFEQGNFDGECSVTNASGVLGSADVNDVFVECFGNEPTPNPSPSPAPQLSIGGTVSGMNPSASESLTLRNNVNNDVKVITGNGPYTFDDFLSQGESYNVSLINVVSDPNANEGGELSCSLENSSGSVGVENVDDINVTCSLVFPE